MTLPKPHTRFYSPELTRLPKHNLPQRIFRRLLGALAWLVVRLVLRTQVQGLENFPRQGPALIVTNHLGDSDVVLGLAFLPPNIDTFAAIDLYYNFPWLGKIMDAYGVIWVHRGIPDRQALRVALRGLAEDRIVAIAPEGRESLTGALESGTSGAAFLALRTGVPITPITYTGTPNKVIYPNLKHFRRSPASLTVGPAFHLQEKGTDRSALDRATSEIMQALARQLPEELRGVYDPKSSPAS
jgi:1-acyl-sn-glycerol-3-phosphate acyltransferase